MFVHSTRLPHVLAPDCYFNPEHYQREVVAFLGAAWHLVGTKSELANPGDFLTCEILGHPVQVRNFDGTLKALSNVCAHRHSIISSQQRGNSPRMTCKYHGWEYGADGCTRKIPEPKNFAPLQRGAFCLDSYRVEICGQLVFVSLEQHGQGLQEHLGVIYDRVANAFGDEWKSSLTWNPEYSVNWKIPLENTLEAYHVPTVHPTTFGEDPGEDRSVHELHRSHTWFGTDLPFSPHSRIQRMFQRCEGWLSRRLGHTPHGRYEHHHIFPNLLFSFTDVVSLCQCIVPTGPGTSRAVVRQFGRVGAKAGLWSPLARVWAQIEGSITKQILKEDIGMYDAIQRGLRASRQSGALGACEERIWAFQTYVQEQCGHVNDISGQPTTSEHQHLVEETI